MYLSELDLIAVSIALVALMATTAISSYYHIRYRQAYENTVRMLKIERSARAYWDEHKGASL
jgi:hypothetical protein